MSWQPEPDFAITSENWGEHQIESLIANLLNGAPSLPQEKIIELVNQLFELSETESIPLTEVPAIVRQKIEEKVKLEEEIQKSRATLDQQNIKIQTIEEFKKLEEELKKRGLSIEDPISLVSILNTVKELGHDPKKIVSEMARLKSLRQTERRLKNNCKMLESRAAQYRQVLPSCQQIVRFGIRIEELIAFHAAVTKRAGVGDLSMCNAAYDVLQDIEKYNELGGMQKQLNNTIMNMQMVNLLSARQNNAANTVLRLFSFGITEQQILEACRFIESNCRNSIPYYAQSNNSSSFVNPHADPAQRLQHTRELWGK